jgi:hypothetical protein
LQNCVRGGQGSPQGVWPHSGAGTPGSSMNRRVIARAASRCRASGIRPYFFLPEPLRIALLAAFLPLLGCRVQLHAESANSMYKHGQARRRAKTTIPPSTLPEGRRQGAQGPDLQDGALPGAGLRLGAAHEKGRKLLEAATSRARWWSFCTPRRLTPATRPRSRRLPSSAKSTARGCRTGRDQPARGGPGHAGGDWTRWARPVS